MISDNIQKVAENLGKSGCYFLSLISVAEEFLGTKVDILDTAEKALCRQYINDDFYVNYPALILEMLTKKKWEVRHSTYPYAPQPNEYVIIRYEFKKTMTTLGHFERDNFKPIINCPTSMLGKPVSTRICRLMN